MTSEPDKGKMTISYIRSTSLVDIFQPRSRCAGVLLTYPTLLYCSPPEPGVENGGRLDLVLLNDRLFIAK